MPASVDPRITAWLCTSIATELSPAKRKNYFDRLIARLDEQELGLRGSATWPRLPVSWGEDPTVDAAFRGGIPRAWLPMTDTGYRVALIEVRDIGRFLRLVAVMAKSATIGGDLTNATAFVVRDASRAWVFLTSHESFDTWTDGELHVLPWTGAGELVWVERSSPDSLVCRWGDDQPDDSPELRQRLAQGPMGVAPERLPDTLLRRFDAGDVQIRVVPLAFEGKLCLPDGVFQVR